MIAGGPYMAPPEKIPLKDVIVSFIKKEDAGIPEKTTLLRRKPEVEDIIEKRSVKEVPQ